MFNRRTLESLDSLEPRKSVLEDDFEEEEEKEENEQIDGLDNGADERVLFLSRHYFFIFDLYYFL